MKTLTVILSVLLFSQVLFTAGFAELDASTSQLVYAPGEPLLSMELDNLMSQSYYDYMHQIIR